MDLGRRAKRPPLSIRLRDLLGLLVPILMIVAGVGLTIASSLPQSQFVGTEIFEGTVLPGDTSRPLARMDYTVVAFEADTLPCPLFVYPLSQGEFRIYLESGALPLTSLDCDRPVLNLTHRVSNLVLRNLDPVDVQNYTVSASFFVVSRPYLLLAIPAIIFVFIGGTTLLVRMLTRGLGRFVRDDEQKE